MKNRDDRKARKGRRARKGRGAGESAPRRDETGGQVAWEWVKSGLIALVLYFLIRTFLLQTFVITSGSMEPTLLVGDFLMVNRAAIGTRLPGSSARIPGYSEPHRWDVIVFDPPHEEELMLVKRLVGMPGDTLSMKDKVLYVNGRPQEEPWVRNRQGSQDESHPWMAWQLDYLVDTVDRTTYRPTRDDWGPIVVPPGHYFMLGDNRDSSLDSRYWGLLERWRLEGRAVFIYFSYERDSPRPFPWLREVRWGRIGNGIQ